MRKKIVASVVFAGLFFFGYSASMENGLTLTIPHSGETFLTRLSFLHPFFPPETGSAVCKSKKISPEIALRSGKRMVLQEQSNLLILPEYCSAPRGPVHDIGMLNYEGRREGTIEINNGLISVMGQPKSEESFFVGFDNGSVRHFDSESLKVKQIFDPGQEISDRFPFGPVSIVETKNGSILVHFFTHGNSLSGGMDGCVLSFDPRSKRVISAINDPYQMVSKDGYFGFKPVENEGEKFYSIYDINANRCIGRTAKIGDEFSDNILALSPDCASIAIADTQGLGGVLQSDDNGGLIAAYHPKKATRGPVLSFDFRPGVPAFLVGFDLCLEQVHQKEQRCTKTLSAQGELPVEIVSGKRTIAAVTIDENEKRERVHVWSNPDSPYMLSSEKSRDSFREAIDALQNSTDSKH